MAISYTTNFHFPKVDDGCENWMAVINGVLEDVDTELKSAQDPLVSRDNGDTLICRRTGEILLKHHHQ